MGLFKTCKSCGALGIKKLSPIGLCSSCQAEKNRIERTIRENKQREAQRQYEEERNREAFRAKAAQDVKAAAMAYFDSKPPKAPLIRKLREPVVDSSVAIYEYATARIVDVDRYALYQMYNAKEIAFDLEPTDDGVRLLWQGQYVAMLRGEKRVSMVQDWQSRGDLIRCFIQDYAPGKEAVYLAFYRREQERLKSLQSQVIRLSGFQREEYQWEIETLVPGEYIRCTNLGENEDGEEITLKEVQARTWQQDPFGVLPSKWATAWKDGDIAAIFYDHGEQDTDYVIPYVKVYLR